MKRLVKLIKIVRTFKADEDIINLIKNCDTVDEMCAKFEKEIKWMKDHDAL
jgi:hypothetical protein